MSLFQKSVLQSYLKFLPKEKVQTAWETFSAHFQNPVVQEDIRTSKEEQYQEGFLDDLFVKVLGYTKKPNPSYNLTTELKNIKNAQKTDGALLRSDGNPFAVIELKGMDTTDLTKVEAQAFGYKNNQYNCTYVIISNFEKLRFYIDNAVDFEEFNLFTITRERFEVLYFCLSFETLLLDDKPKKAKEETLNKEEDITKKLYNDYADFRNALFKNIQTLNPSYDKLTLFKKTQKLLDRFLFIFFAEDKNLLPPNLTENIIDEWRDLEERHGIKMDLYDKYKRYFEFLYVGHRNKYHSIFPYNGGLFAPDTLLDSLKIDNTLLARYTQKISLYDFDSEVSVNILGHIFEHSLNDFEEIQAEIEGKEVEKTTTRRKKDGVFYTPKYITKYIVDNTVGKLCQDKKIELEILENDLEKNYEVENGKPIKNKKIREQLQEKTQNYKNWLSELTICDPACGSGAFLNQVLEFLIAEHHYLYELELKLIGTAQIDTELENKILKNNIFGVDINEESVEIAKLSLWLRTAYKGRKLTTLNDNIKVGNSLIDDPKIAGEKAFNWQNEFPQIFQKGGFDVIVGNPPYGVKFDNETKIYLSNFDNLVPDYEIYIYFISLYKKILKKEGLLSYIFPNTFLSTLFGKAYRDFIFSNNCVYQIVDLSNDNTFVDAGVRTCIFSFVNSEKNYVSNLYKIKDNEFILHELYDKKHLLTKTDNILSLFHVTKKGDEIINKILNNESLSNFYKLSQGLIPYDKYRGHDEFTIKNRIWHSETKKDDTYKKELKGADVTRYNIEWNGNLWISYGDWLAAPRDSIFFTKPRILVREITGDRLFCSYTEEEFYNTPSCINIINNENNLELKYLLSILNSSLIGWFHNQVSPKAKKGLFPKILVNDIKNLPIPNITKEAQEPFIELANKMLSLNEEFSAKKNRFLRRLEENFKLDKLTKKLENFYEFDFSVHKEELKKKKIELTFKMQDEWQDYFEEYKKDLLALQSQIQSTDNQIDDLVFELYGLTEEEIKLIKEA